MLHKEHLRKADETYEIRHDSLGNAIHVYITDGLAVVYPSLDYLIKRVYFGSEVERFYIEEYDLSKLYESDDYSYHSLRELARSFESFVYVN